MVANVQKETKKIAKELEKKFDETAQLIVFNDDVNTFDYVINCFIDICKLSQVEAVEKTYSIHYKGLDIVKEGALQEMKQQKNALVDCGLSAAVQIGSAN